VSFRLRVLALVSLVAVTAVAATAYLTLEQASRQVSQSAAADRQTVALIVDGLVDYARRHGTWEGVPEAVRDLKARTGQRIKLVTESGAVVVDSDTLEGRTARAVTATPYLADPRPRLVLPEPAVTPEMSRRLEPLTLDAIGRYRSGVRFAACLTRHRIDVALSPGENGVPEYAAAGDAARTRGRTVDDCRAASNGGDDDAAASRQVEACSDHAKVECLMNVFTRQTVELAPVPLQVYLGAAGQAGRSLAPGPVVAAAAVVALLAMVGTALLSRRMLRPVVALTAASRRLGAGDLSLRVPAVGRDELAELASSFNRMADSLQRGEERQRRLVADVAHELRTPLANLRGYLEALKDGVIPPDPELFASLHEEAILQQRIVDDLQDLALAEAGALAYHSTWTDLAELLETCRAAQQAAADAGGVTLAAQADGPVVVRADPDRLRQVIGNLVANALRATPAGGSVTLCAAGAADGWASVVVRDTGVGIAPADLPRIFDRFWRTDTARGRATGGAGLGLAIARQIVTDHGGRITADSRPGAGTTITIALPRDGGLPPR
jgi:two-component system, OmpR family, sensor histidine kinase BaeS